ncbi:MAG: DUF456 domain-containing protein [Bacteroidales bacterium]|nr:DUF456 domain-containing protein [Bacteroidales bacterium]MBN2819695.1 DUF456 domain-containing protein [Bacteroidales bacterium]
MDWLILFLGIVLIVLGLVGCIVPVLPGPPLSFIGMLMVHFTRFADFTNNMLITMGFLALVVQILDYIVPVWGTKKFGGSKYGTWGSIIGLIAGIFVLPSIVVIGPFGIIGIIAGPFFGALIGEIIAGQTSEKAFKAAFGSFIGFLTGTLMKLATSIIITFIFAKEIISNIF